MTPDHSVHFPGDELVLFEHQAMMHTAHIVEGGLRNVLLGRGENNVQLVDKIQIFTVRKKDFVEGDFGGLLCCDILLHYFYH